MSNELIWRNRTTFIDLLTQYSRRQSEMVLIIHGLVGTLAVAGADYLFGNAISVRPLYLVPVFVLALGGGQTVGRILAGIGLAALVVVDMLRLQTGVWTLPVYLNWLVGGGVFALTSQVGVGLKNIFDRERELARTDALTGMANRRAFCESAAREISRARRLPRPLTMVYIDVDNFKQVNDCFGHAVGDRLLEVIGEVMQRNLRLHDISARVGGDEFAVLLPETAHDAARFVVERLHKCLREAMHHQGWPVTFSIGVVTYGAPPATVEELIKAADQAMYAIKRVGKNMIRYEVWSLGEQPR